jgi:hypothetical protein
MCAGKSRAMPAGGIARAGSTKTNHIAERRDEKNQRKNRVSRRAGHGFGVLGISPRARAESFHFKAHDSGTFLSTTFHFTTNPDEGTAVGETSGKGDKGHYSTRFVAGAVLTSSPPTPCTLLNGGSGISFTFVGDETVFRFDSTGDQLFAVSAPGGGMECFGTSGPPNAFSGTESFTITGGTGRFANASGTLTTEIHGQYLVFLNPSGGSFGWVEDEWTGDISTH